MISVDDFKQAWKELEIEKAKRDFLAHLSTYIIVNVFLVFVNYFTSPEHIWFHWVLLAWGIGLAFHFVFSRERFLIPDWEEKVARIEMRARKGKGQ